RLRIEARSRIAENAAQPSASANTVRPGCSIAMRSIRTVDASAARLAASPAPHSAAQTTTDARHQNFSMRNARRSSPVAPSPTIESVTSAIALPGGSTPAPLRTVPGALPEGVLRADSAPLARQRQRIGRYRAPCCREKAASGATGVLEPRREPDPGRDVEILRPQ